MSKRVLVFFSVLAWSHGAFAALNFSSTDYLTVPDSTSLNITGTGLTLNCWVNRATPGAGLYIISKCNSLITTGYALRTTASSVRFSLAVSGVSKNLSGTTAGMWDSTWHMATATYDGANMRIYTDSVEDAASPLAAVGTLTSSTGQSLAIGTEVAVPSSPFGPGSVEDVLILPYVITTQQRKALFLSRQRMIVTPCGGHWRFDEGNAGATVVGYSFKDLCGNGNTLTSVSDVGATLQVVPSILNYP